MNVARVSPIRGIADAAARADNQGMDTTTKGHEMFVCQCNALRNIAHEMGSEGCAYSDDVRDAEYADLDAELADLTREAAWGRAHPYAGTCGDDDARADRIDAIRAALAHTATPLDVLNEDGRGNDRAASALSLYRFARFTQGLDTTDATERIAGLFGITFGDAGRLVGIGLGQREGTRN